MTPRLSTISPALPFLPTLAKGIVERAGSMGADSIGAASIGPDLTRFRILLPTRRSCRELQNAFLDLSGGRPLLLPRMHPLGDIDAEELDILTAGALEAETVDTIPPALSVLEREMILTGLVQKRDSAMRGEQCLALARALGKLMDEVYVNGLDLKNLPGLLDEARLSDHWLQTVSFLSILSEHWPDILAERGRIDAADRRNRLVRALARYWQDNPPQNPVIAAGTTASTPATAALLSVVARLPQGEIVLPGLDLELDSDSWDRLGETHPQAAMKALIDAVAASRNSVTGFQGKRDGSSPRIRAARAATCPSDTCDTIALSADDLRAGLEGVTLIEAANPRSEAQAIGLIVRDCLETHAQSCVIVTPDRNLARRISAALKRWDITVDDSAGRMLSAKPGGIFVMKIIACLIADFAPLALLDLLKSPFIRTTDNAAVIHEIETAGLRGPRPPPGLAGLASHLSAKNASRDALDFIAALERSFAPLLPFSDGDHNLKAFVPALVLTAESLIDDPDRLWSQQDGEALAGLLAELEDAGRLMPDAPLRSLRSFIGQFMNDRVIRPLYGTHPRVTILGQLEARLIGADVTILAGLNEGTWPPETPADPWMSRPMRKRFGLPPPERGIGLSAHDFVQGFCAGTVFLTRARKIDGTPTVPARWLQRLSALLAAAGLDRTALTLYADTRWLPWLSALDRPEKVTAISRPEPRPPVDARPHRLGVTGIETLMRNPYQIYARYILGLRPLDPLDQDVSASTRGEFIHDILNNFVKAHPKILPPDAADQLLALGRQKLAALERGSPDWDYWWPRFENLVPEFIAHEKDWRRGHDVWRTETKGELRLNYAGRDFILSAKADRIDRRRGGTGAAGLGAAVIDYKTGATPAMRDVVRGRSPQLPLEALMLTRGAFDGLTIAVDDISLNYWTLTGKRDPLAITDLGTSKIRRDGKTEAVPVAELVDDAAIGLDALLGAFMDETTPYRPVMPTGRLYDEEKAYKHLARCDEWGIAGDGSDEDEG